MRWMGNTTQRMLLLGKRQETRLRWGLWGDRPSRNPLTMDTPRKSSPATGLPRWVPWWANCPVVTFWYWLWCDLLTYNSWASAHHCTSSNQNTHLRQKSLKKKQNDYSSFFLLLCYHSSSNHSKESHYIFQAHPTSWDLAMLRIIIHSESKTNAEWDIKIKESTVQFFIK